jgi:hypothetical protein
MGICTCSSGNHFDEVYTLFKKHKLRYFANEALCDVEKQTILAVIDMSPANSNEFLRLRQANIADSSRNRVPTLFIYDASTIKFNSNLYVHGVPFNIDRFKSFIKYTIEWLIICEEYFDSTSDLQKKRQIRYDINGSIHKLGGF